MDNEGSVSVDGVTGAEETTEEESKVEGQNQGKEESKDTKSDDKSEPNKDSVNNGKTQYTEKGTKLDPDPMSALNQQLANERRVKADYEKILTDPKSLTDYAKTMGLGLTKEEAQEIQDEVDPDKIETVEDLRKFAKGLQTKIENKSKELDNGIKGVQESRREEAVSSLIRDDIKAVREQYPELDPKPDSEGNPTNPDYNKELDATIGDLYEMADYDKDSKKYLGKVRIADVAKKVMSARQNGVTTGSRNAQTVVREKVRGAPITGASSDLPDESNMTPSQVIASRMKQMHGR